MQADWIEMKQIRKRRIADAVWIPLRAVETIREEGRYGYPGYLHEFFGLGSVAVSLTQRDEAKTLSWSDIGIMHDQGIWATNEFYKPRKFTNTTKQRTWVSNWRWSSVSMGPKRRNGI